MSNLNPGTITDARGDVKRPDRLWKVIRQKCEQILVSELHLPIEAPDFEDLASEATFAFWIAYRDQPAHFPSGGSIYAFLRTVLLNKLRDLWRRQACAKKHQAQIEDRQRALNERVHNIKELESAKKYLLEFVMKYEEDTRPILQLYLDGLSLRDIVNQLNCTLHTVRTVIDQFKQAVSEDSQTEELESLSHNNFKIEIC